MQSEFYNIKIVFSASGERYTIPKNPLEMHSGQIEEMAFPSLQPVLQHLGKSVYSGRQSGFFTCMLL
jgi:hypothetical protein